MVLFQANAFYLFLLVTHENLLLYILVMWTPLQEEIVSGWWSTNKHMSTRTVMTQILRLKTTSKIGCIPLPRSKSSFLFESVWDFPEQGDVVLGAWLPPSVETNVYSQGDKRLAEQTKEARFTLQMFVKQLCILLVRSGHRHTLSVKSEAVINAMLGICFSKIDCFSSPLR